MMPYDPTNLSSAASNQAATFVDYGNLYSVLAAQTNDTGAPEDFANEILQEVRRYLAEGDDTPTVLGRAYADFHTLLDTSDASLMADLDREGLEPVYASTEVQANADELRLCMDVMDLLATQTSVGTVVIVTGNRAFLPLVRRIRERGRRALVAIVNPPRAPEGLPQGDGDVYLDARNLLSRSSREALLQSASRSRNGSSSASAGRAKTSPPPLYRPLTSDTARRTIEITEEYFGQYDEVYLTPLLRKLSDVLGDAHDPKALVSELEAAGAVRLEKREGYPYDYTVLIVNEDHPSVQEIHDDYYTGRSPFTYEEIAGSASSESFSQETSDAAASSEDAAAAEEAATFEEAATPDDTPSAADRFESASPPASADAARSDDRSEKRSSEKHSSEGASSVSPYADRAPAEASSSDESDDSPVGDDASSDVDAPSP